VTLTREQIEDWRKKIDRKIWSDFLDDPNEAHGSALRKQWNALCDMALAAAPSAPIERRKGERDFWLICENGHENNPANNSCWQCGDKSLTTRADRRKPNAAPPGPQQEDSSGVVESRTGGRPKARNESGSDTAPAVAAPSGAGETPLTDALIDSMLCANGVPVCHEWNRLVEHARSLERALVQAREALRTAREVAHGEGWDEHMALVADRICVDIGIDACRKMDSALAAIDKLKGGT
jgi:hypothetical protein